MDSPGSSFRRRMEGRYAVGRENATAGRPVVVGLMPGQSPVVIETAADFAQQLGVPVVCAYVDPTRFHAAGPEYPPVDPDAIDDGENAAAAVESWARSRLAARGVPWSFKALAGEPERELSALAKRAGAAMIVVGARRHGIGARLENIVAGSVGAHLAHHQRLPVLVVPVNGPRHGTAG